MIKRLGHVLRALLITIDIVLCFLWLAPLYLVGLADKPTGTQLISGYTGRAAINRQRWALTVEKIIDRVLGAGHCRAVAIRLAGFGD